MAIDRASGHPATERAIAPDLARGLMLLLIVLSNSTFFLWALPLEPGGYQRADGPADAIAQLLMLLVVDVRTYPLFAFLFGYGMMQVFRRRTAAGDSPNTAGRVLRRRSLALLGLGFCHAALLLPSDVLGAYGLLGLLLGWLFLRRSARVQLVAAVVGAGILGLVLVVSVVGAGALLAAGTGGLAASTGPGETGPGETGPGETGSGETGPGENGASQVALGTEAELLFGHATAGYLESIPLRLASWAGITAITVVGLVAAVAMLLGFVAARYEVLAHPERHRRLLGRVAALGCATGLFGACCAALLRFGVLPSGPSLSGLVFATQWTTGLAGGLGYAALIGLVSIRLGRRNEPGRLLGSVLAVGKRSLSCYLTHSLLLGPVLAAWGFGLGARLGSGTMASYAIGVWLVTVVLAGLAERSGSSSAYLSRGPAEVLLRRLTYGRSWQRRAGTG